MKKKIVRNIIIAIIAILILVIAVCGIFFIRVSKNLDAVMDISIEDVDLSAVSDGTYAGSYDTFPIFAAVLVTVKEHQIIEIELVEHKNGKGQAAETIPEIVVEAQSLQVDTVSGATFSSKVILLAIEDALKDAAGE